MAKIIKKSPENKIVLFTDKKGNVELRADVEKDTLWATQEQIAKLFSSERSVITKHITNLLKVGEVDQKGNVQKMHIANSDKPVLFYSLDIILAVGYRTNSIKAIKFRKWATIILRNYLIKGYNLNQHQLLKSKTNIEGLHEAVTFLESNKNEGPLKGKITFKLTKHLTGK